MIADCLRPRKFGRPNRLAFRCRRMPKFDRGSNSRVETGVFRRE